jgi:hypothetical protein
MKNLLRLTFLGLALIVLNANASIIINSVELIDSSVIDGSQVSALNLKDDSTVDSVETTEGNIIDSSLIRNIHTSNPLNPRTIESDAATVRGGEGSGG